MEKEGKRFWLDTTFSTLYFYISKWWTFLRDVHAYISWNLWL